MALDARTVSQACDRELLVAAIPVSQEIPWPDLRCSLYLNLLLKNITIHPDLGLRLNGYIASKYPRVSPADLEDATGFRSRPCRASAVRTCKPFSRASHRRRCGCGRRTTVFFILQSSTLKSFRVYGPARVGVEFRRRRLGRLHVRPEMPNLPDPVRRADDARGRNPAARRGRVAQRAPGSLVQHPERRVRRRNQERCAQQHPDQGQDSERVLSPGEAVKNVYPMSNRNYADFTK